MAVDLFDVEAPPALPARTPAEILHGPHVAPLDYIARYSDGEFEQMIEEWAFYYLQGLRREYRKVHRLGGSGDKGRDIIGYVDLDADPIVIDVYQCKHYGHPLRPSEFWPELAKLCYFTFTKTVPVPRKYFIVAPQNCGPELTALIDTPADLKRDFIAEWKNTSKNKPLYKSVAGGAHELIGELEKYVNDFDFRRIASKPILEVVEELRNIPHKYSPRFGGGLIKPPPADITPPAQIAPSEARYVNCLLEAYRQHKNDNALTCENLVDQLALHFKVSRVRYYCAETIKEFSKDTLPDGFTFAQVQDQVYHNVIDTVLRPDITDGYIRVIEVVQAAKDTKIVNHPLREYLKVPSLQGICHQLANEGTIKWVA
jgi:hypothetical protein